MLVWVVTRGVASSLPCQPSEKSAADELSEKERLAAAEIVLVQHEEDEAERLARPHTHSGPLPHAFGASPGGPFVTPTATRGHTSNGGGGGGGGMHGQQLQPLSATAPHGYFDPRQGPPMARYDAYDRSYDRVAWGTPGSNASPGGGGGGGWGGGFKPGRRAGASVEAARSLYLPSHPPSELLNQREKQRKRRSAAAAKKKRRRGKQPPRGGGGGRRGQDRNREGRGRRVPFSASAPSVGLQPSQVPWDQPQLPQHPQDPQHQHQQEHQQSQPPEEFGYVEVPQSASRPSSQPRLPPPSQGFGPDHGAHGGQGGVGGGGDEYWVPEFGLTNVDVGASYAYVPGATYTGPGSGVDPATLPSIDADKLAAAFRAHLSPPSRGARRRRAGRSSQRSRAGRSGQRSRGAARDTMGGRMRGSASASGVLPPADGATTTAAATTTTTSSSSSTNNNSRDARASAKARRQRAAVTAVTGSGGASGGGANGGAYRAQPAGRGVDEAQRQAATQSMLNRRRSAGIRVTHGGEVSTLDKPAGGVYGRLSPPRTSPRHSGGGSGSGSGGSSGSGGGGATSPGGGAGRQEGGGGGALSPPRSVHNQGRMAEPEDDIDRPFVAVLGVHASEVATLGSSEAAPSEIILTATTLMILLRQGSGVPPNLTWPSIRAQLRDTITTGERLAAFDAGAVAPFKLRALRPFLQSAKLRPGRFPLLPRVAHALTRFILAVLQSSAGYTKLVGQPVVDKLLAYVAAFPQRLTADYAPLLPSPAAPAPAPLHAATGGPSTIAHDGAATQPPPPPPPPGTAGAGVGVEEEEEGEEGATAPSAARGARGGAAKRRHGRRTGRGRRSKASHGHHGHGHHGKKRSSGRSRSRKAGSTRRSVGSESPTAGTSSGGTTTTTITTGGFEDDDGADGHDPSGEASAGSGTGADGAASPGASPTRTSSRSSRSGRSSKRRRGHKRSSSGSGGRGRRGARKSGSRKRAAIPSSSRSGGGGGGGGGGHHGPPPPGPPRTPPAPPSMAPPPLVDVEEEEEEDDDGDDVDHARPRDRSRDRDRHTREHHDAGHLDTPVPRGASEADGVHVHFGGVTTVLVPSTSSGNGAGSAGSADVGAPSASTGGPMLFGDAIPEAEDEGDDTVGASGSEEEEEEEEGDEEQAGMSASRGGVAGLEDLASGHAPPPPPPPQSAPPVDKHADADDHDDSHHTSDRVVGPHPTPTAAKRQQPQQSRHHAEQAHRDAVEAGAELEHKPVVVHRSVRLSTGEYVVVSVTLAEGDGALMGVRVYDPRACRHESAAVDVATAVQQVGLPAEMATAKVLGSRAGRTVLCEAVAADVEELRVAFGPDELFAQETVAPERCPGHDRPAVSHGAIVLDDTVCFVHAYELEPEAGFAYRVGLLVKLYNPDTTVEVATALPVARLAEFGRTARVRYSTYDRRFHAAVLSHLQLLRDRRTRSAALVLVDAAVRRRSRVLANHVEAASHLNIPDTRAETAALTIQGSFRCRLARQEVRRRRSDRRRVTDLRHSLLHTIDESEAEAAAVKVQSVARRRAATKRVAALRSRAAHAAEHADDFDALATDPEAHAAAVRIQSQARRAAATRRVADARTRARLRRRREAATRLQGLQRGASARREVAARRAAAGTAVGRAVRAAGGRPLLRAARLMAGRGYLVTVRRRPRVAGGRRGHNGGYVFTARPLVDNTSSSSSSSSSSSVGGGGGGGGGTLTLTVPAFAVMPSGAMARVVGMAEARRAEELTQLQARVASLTVLRNRLVIGRAKPAHAAGEHCVALRLPVVFALPDSGGGVPTSAAVVAALEASEAAADEDVDVRGVGGGRGAGGDGGGGGGGGGSGSGSAAGPSRAGVAVVEHSAVVSCYVEAAEVSTHATPAQLAGASAAAGASTVVHLDVHDMTSMSDSHLELRGVDVPELAAARRPAAVVAALMDVAHELVLWVQVRPPTHALVMLGCLSCVSVVCLWCVCCVCIGVGVCIVSCFPFPFAARLRFVVVVVVACLLLLCCRRSQASNAEDAEERGARDEWPLSLAMWLPHPSMDPVVASEVVLGEDSDEHAAPGTGDDEADATSPPPASHEGGTMRHALAAAGSTHRLFSSPSHRVMPGVVLKGAFRISGRSLLINVQRTPTGMFGIDATDAATGQPLCLSLLELEAQLAAADPAAFEAGEAQAVHDAVHTIVDSLLELVEDEDGVVCLRVLPTLPPPFRCSRAIGNDYYVFNVGAGGRGMYAVDVLDPRSAWTASVSVTSLAAGFRPNGGQFTTEARALCEQRLTVEGEGDDRQLVFQQQQS